MANSTDCCVTHYHHLDDKASDIIYHIDIKLA